MNKKIKSDVFTFDENIVIVNQPDDKKNESLDKKKIEKPEIKKVKSIHKIDMDQELKDNPFFFF
tara:strand:+ start:1103 stop:1294 length:192 start_codon:yes stop_codon:yes gene_type:complete